MADITLNFSSQWQSLQVAKVIASPQNEGETAAYPYIKKIPHGLGYPPFCMGYDSSGMRGVDVDETYIYIAGNLDCVAIFSLDITKPFEYPHYTSEVGTVLEDTSGGTLDLRKFLIHSRAVSPMLLSVVTKDYIVGDLTLTYTSPLSYPTFSFGYLRGSQTIGGFIAGIWIAVPLSGQAYPVMQTDGYTSSLYGDLQAVDKGSIIILRNPAIVTNNTVSVTI